MEKRCGLRDIGLEINQMGNKKLFYFTALLLISLLIVQCGGRYEPEMVPVRINESDPMSKERVVIENDKEDPKDEIDKSRVEETEIDDSADIFQQGIASWYGGKFQGRRTANGEVYDKYKLTAAHKTLPFNSIVEVTNISNEKTVIVRINDRGPFVKGRIIDLSKKAANMIGMEDTGTAPVLLKVLNKVALNNTHKEVLFSRSKQSNKIQSEKLKPEQLKLESSLIAPKHWFYIQAGAFQDRINAERVLDKIKRVTDTKFLIRKNNGFYKVLSVKLSPRSLAEKVSSDLKEYYIDTFVKSY